MVCNILTEEDKIWLNKKYPNLVYSKDGDISGNLVLIATYNKTSNIFLILGDNIENTIGGLQLTGTFNIKIRETKDKTLSLLPSLYVKEIEAIADRHVNQTLDPKACLCSPFIEHLYLTPTFSFKKYFEELVIPFLYGQIFYNKEKRWPWNDLSHGSIGLLESYYKINDFNKAKECLERLPKDSQNWSRIKQLLSLKKSIKGHALCLCGKKNKIRSCHIDAWKGAELLRQNIKEQKLIIPF